MPKRSGKKRSHNKSKSRNTSNNSSSSSHGISKSQQSTLYYFTGAFCLIFLFCAFFIYLPQMRAIFGFADTSIDPAKLRGYRARLNKLYSKYNPNKLDEIDDILLKYRGREKELFKKLHLKYVKPNKKVRDEQRKEKRRKRKFGDDDDVIPENETEEEAAIRRRKKKERDRQKRKEKRRKERGGHDYYDDDEYDADGQRNKYKKIFGDDASDGYYGDNYAQYEGEIDLIDDEDDEDE